MATDMEKTFKAIFVFGIIIFCLLIIGLFLILLKGILIFNQQINIMGMVITNS
jgi:hypothetical protein